MSYVVIWFQACLHWRCAYFQTVSWSYTIFVVDWDILYKLCGSANKWSKGFVFPGKIWWQFFSCNKACSKYHTRSTTTPKYTLTQRLVLNIISKITRPLGHFWILPSWVQTWSAICRCVRMNTSRKRSQNHFRLHFTSKLHIHLIQAIFKTRNGESGNGNDNGNGERGTGNL